MSSLFLSAIIVDISVLKSSNSLLNELDDWRFVLLEADWRFVLVEADWRFVFIEADWRFVFIVDDWRLIESVENALDEPK